MAHETSVVRRRRVALSLSAVLAVAAAAAVFFSGTRTYEATASVLLLPPTSTVEENGNPLLQLGGLQQVVDVLAAEVRNRVGEPDFVAEYPHAGIDVAPDGRTSAPTLAVIVQDADPASALAIRDEVAAVALSELEQIQTAIAIEPNRQVTGIMLTASPSADERLTDRIRTAIVAGAGVSVALLLLAGLLESILVRRHSALAGDPDEDVRRSSAASPTDVEPAAPDTAHGDGIAPDSSSDPGIRPPDTPLDHVSAQLDDERPHIRNLADVSVPR